jgi:hypothetical protein
MKATAPQRDQQFDFELGATNFVRDVPNGPV